MKIGETIRTLRKQNNLTQKQLGELCKPSISESTIRKYELGLLNPKVQTIEKIANALCVDKWEIIGFSEGFWIADSSNPTFSIQEQTPESLLLTNFSKLNQTGKKEAVKRLEELTQIPTYTKPEE